MTSPESDVDDPVIFYFRLNDYFRSLNVPAVQSLATGMAVSTLPDKSWQAIADRLGFTAQQIDVLALEPSWQAPLRMLKDWGNRPSSKIRVIRKILVDVGREDLVQKLDELRKHGFDLYVCFKSETGSDNHVEVKVEGRKPLYVALVRTLEDMTNARTTFYRLVSERNSWHTECHEFQGQQIDIITSARSGVTPPPDGRNQFRINHRASLVDDRMLKVTPHGDGPNPGASIDSVASDYVSTLVVVENVDRRPLANAANRNVCCAESRPAAPPGGADRQLSSLSSAEGDGLFDFRETDDWSQPRIDATPAAAAAPTVLLMRPDADDAVDVGRRPKAAEAGDAKDEVVIRDLRRTRGYHETVGNRSSLIKTAMRWRGRRNGEYIIRSFTDQDTGQLKVALTVVYNGGLRHFLIHRRLAADGDKVTYYLFTGDFESSSLSKLLDHYTHHPMAPEARNENDHALAPRLLLPIIAAQC